MCFCENKKNILNSREAFLKFQIVDCGSKLSCRQDKMIKKFDFKTPFDIFINFLSKASKKAHRSNEI
jgi:hypothetical protein